MSKAPAPPDPYAVSAAQTQSNQQTAAYEASLNRVNQVTPLGSSTWNGTGPGATQTVSLTPDAQADLTNQLRQDANLSGLGDHLATQAGTSLQGQLNTASLPSLSGGPGMLGHVTTDFAPTGQLASAPGAVGQTQSSLDYSHAPQVSNNFNALTQQAQNAVYNQATSRLDPQFANAQSDLNSSLANQGVVQGSEAYQRAQDEFARQKTDAYNQANYSAIGAGNQLEGQLYGQSLAGRQQAVGEANTQGAFANSAQQQQYDQALQNAGFTNAAQAQQYGQNMGAAQFGNSAQAQQYAQALQSNALNDQARAQGLTEQTNLQELPLNELNALRSQTQVQQPTFSSVPTSTVAPTNTAANTWNAYNAQVANSNNFMNGLFGMAGAGLQAAGNAGGFAALFSDKRLKRNLKRIGKTLGGLAIYEFQYRWSKVRHVGVIAQDALRLQPEAVLVHPSGYLMVDYARVR